MPKPFFTIVRKSDHRVYDTNLFRLCVFNNKSNRILTVFTNGTQAAAVFLDRSEVASLLSRQFKNSVDRRISRANMSANPNH